MNMLEKKCIYGEPVFFEEDYKARREGHIYSKAGVDEYRISQCCEYHFDQMFAEDD